MYKIGDYLVIDSDNSFGYISNIENEVVTIMSSENLIYSKTITDLEDVVRNSNIRIIHPSEFKLSQLLGIYKWK